MPKTLKPKCPHCDSLEFRSNDTVPATCAIRYFELEDDGSLGVEYGDQGSEIHYDAMEPANGAKPYECAACFAAFGDADIIAASGRKKKTALVQPETDAQRQAKFVRELVNNVARDLLRDIAAGKLPEAWDGIQLRALLAERFKRACMGREGERKFWRDYRNEVVVRNL